jgi:hypothetical protein
MEADAARAAAEKLTPLTGYFKAVADELSHPLTDAQRGTAADGSLLPEAKDLTYREFPEYYTCDTKTHSWKRRQRPHHAAVIGRIYTVHPKEGERFYLRLLLVHTKGATSFLHLRSFQGIQYPTFKAACCARGLLADDNEWSDTLLEAASMMGSKQLRDLFIYILFHNEPANPLALWNLVVDVASGRNLHVDMAEDFRRDRGALEGNRAVQVNDDDINQCIYALDDAMRVISNGAKGFIEHYNIQPTGDRRQQRDPSMRAVEEERSYDTNEQAEIFSRDYSLLRPRQKEVFDELHSAIQEQRPGLYFLDAPGNKSTSTHNLYPVPNYQIALLQEALGRPSYSISYWLLRERIVKLVSQLHRRVSRQFFYVVEEQLIHAGKSLSMLLWILEQVLRDDLR